MGIKTKFKNVREYVSHFSRLIDLERREEMSFHKSEIARLSAEERERVGRDLIDLKARYEGQLLMKHIFSFKKRDSSPLPETEIKVGDVVLVGSGDPLKYGMLGTVIEKSRSRIVVAFEETLPQSWKRRALRLDLFCNDVTFRRMLEALSHLRSAKTMFPVSALLGMKAAKIKKDRVNKIKFFNKKLNDSQKAAVAGALSTRPIFLIHGPPGTGKTTTCVEIIKQFVARGARVLVTSDSNTAVDNLVERLAGKVSLVRVGHPARVSKKIYEHFLDFMIECSEEKDVLDELSARIEEIKMKRAKLHHPKASLRRGLSDEQILKLAKKKRGARGLGYKDILKMSIWISYTQVLKQLIKKREELINRIAKKIIREAQVVCTTNAGCFSDLLKDETFDVVVIDEATQATEPACLMPIIKAPIAIIAGDHKQLPPTVISEDAKKQGLAYSLFERFMKLYGNKASIMLEYQYRMNPAIMQFSSRRFYGGKLKAHRSIESISIKDLIGKSGKLELDAMERAIMDERAVVFFDTAGCSRERKRADSPSFENVYEAMLVKRVVSCLFDLNVKPEQIGIITPYKDQSELLKRVLKHVEVEVNTVDGFQGREKDIIIISFVRSNIRRMVGFLKDERRLNVAITRARRKLILIGDSETLCSTQVYRELLDYIKTNGIYARI